MTVDNGVAAIWKTHPWVKEGDDKLRFGLGFDRSGDWAKQRDLAQAIDELGYDSLWVGEHPSIGSECWSSLAMLATVTRRVRLGSLASCVYFRSPQMLARQAADVDRLSNGRLVLGIGAGWIKSEFEFMGIPYPCDAERLRHVEETIAIVRQLWSCPAVIQGELAGRSFEFASSIKPVQQPHVPLLIAGAGERVVLRQVADHADMCNVEVVKAPTADDLKRKFKALRGFCAQRRRPYHSVIRSHLLNFMVLAETQSELVDKVNAFPLRLRSFPIFRACTPRDLIEYYQPLIDAGAQYLIVGGPLDFDLPTARLFAEKVMPELQDYFQMTNPYKIRM